MAKAFGLIIGSGWDGLVEGDSGSEVETAFGLPSTPVRRLLFGDRQVLSVARHGDGHTIPPHLVNYRANLLGLKKMGAEAIIALNTVGVITPVVKPGQLAVPDQIIDYTSGREHTIFDTRRGTVKHVDFTQPFSAELRDGLLEAARKAGVDCYDGGVYAVTQGPRLETAAEVDRLERDGADFIGMTAMPEAAIARETGLDYACLAMVVNRAAGRGDRSIHDDLEASMAITRNATMSTLVAFFAAVS
jgi:purine nucleoside phosphorylase